MNAKLEESAKAEFEEIVEEREAIAHLNELDRLVSEARERKDESGDGDQEGDAYVLNPCSIFPFFWGWGISY